ncbi:MAG: BatA domain-containing protein [Gammaproteobacteria bacterium]|nr:BatA domain-containing protein [Gammaproteobacteria bacterium]
MTFVAAPLLLGLILVAVPLWLHRTHREAPRRGFSSLFLMRAAEEPVHAERTLRYLVLLALRCALLAAAALAFAGPVLSGLLREDGGASEGDEARVPLVVLDRSLSMARADVWDDALRRVERLAADGPAVLVGAGAELELLTAARRSISPEAARLGYGGLVSRVAAVAANLPREGTGFALHLISDFQASAVPDRFNALIEGAALPLIVHPVGGTEDNWAVESLQLSGDEAIARIASHADTRREAGVVLRVGEVLAGRTTRVLPARARTEVRFTLPPDTQAALDTEVVVSLESPDALPADDRARAVLRARRSGSALAIVASRDAAAEYVAAAADAAGLPFAPTRVGGRRGSEDWPAGVELVALLDPGGLSADVSRRVSRLLAGGGGVLLAVGPRTAGAGVLPVIEQAVERTVRADAGDARVVVEDPGHPAAGDGWRDVAVFRSVVPVEPTAGEVILSLQDGRPLLTEYRIGPGRVLVLYTALNREWTSLVVRPAFVRFVADALRYLGNDLGALEAVAGAALYVPAASVQVFDADGARVLGLASTADRPTVRLAEPGFYTVRTPGRSTLLAVNVDPRESDLRAADPGLLARWEDAIGVEAVGSAPVAAAEGERGVTDRERPLGIWLLALLALLLVVEPLVANVGRLPGLPRKVPV